MTSLHVVGATERRLREVLADLDDARSGVVDVVDHTLTSSPKAVLNQLDAARVAINVAISHIHTAQELS